MKQNSDVSENNKVADSTDNRSGKISSGAEVFPLRLVPFERYMLVDERTNYPMTFWVKATLSGKVNRTAMNEAFVDALNRHHMLNARLARQNKKLCWVHDSKEPPAIEWCEASDYKRPPVAQHIDLRRDAGLAVWGVCSEDTTELLLLVHHAICDGIGIIRFLGDLLAFYGQRTAGEGEKTPKLLPIKTENLSYRGQFDFEFPAPISFWEIVKGTISETWKVFARRPVPVHVEKCPTREIQDSESPMVCTVLPEGVYQGLCDTALAQNITVNDLMLRDLFLTLRDWNESHGKPMSKRWLRINMPTSMRGKRDARMPAANILGYALLTRRGDECDDKQQLLSTLSTETEVIRKWGLGGMFVDGVRMFSLIPGLLRLTTRIPFCFATVVLSNVGDASRRFRARFPRVDGQLQVGDLVLDSVIGCPPVRPGTRLVVCMLTNNGIPTFSLRWDPRWFCREKVQAFWNRYLSHLRGSSGFEQENPSEEIDGNELQSFL